MTYDKMEKLMAQIKIIEIYTESRIHNLHSENLTMDKQDQCEKRVKRAKQEIFELFQEK